MTLDPESLVIIVFTTVIHFIGIGLFVVWLAIGKPKSGDELKAWWRSQRFFFRR